MIGICLFCNQEKELTNHHIIAKSYGGLDDQYNLIPNICRECHNEIESKMKEARGHLGAGRPVSHYERFTVGQTELTLRNGSSLLSSNQIALINSGSPIYGARVHNQQTGQRDIELSYSENDKLAIIGSPSNTWVIYSMIQP